MNTVLHGHVSPETAYTVDDYPYGGYRTKCRWWLETATKGRGKNQMRCMQQTLNPKKGVWNKPHASTYEDFMVLYLDDKGHCHHQGASAISPNYIMKFINTGMYFQLDSVELTKFYLVMARAKILNPNCWGRLLQAIEFARANPAWSSEQLRDAMQNKRPDDMYIYEAEMAEVLMMVGLEKQFNTVIIFPK